MKKKRDHINNLFLIKRCGDGMKKETKRLLAIGSILALLTYYGVDYKYHPSYEIYEDSSEAFGRYSKGNIYIGSLKKLLSLENVSIDDILVLDQRFSECPNMKILNSYRVNDKEDRNDIIEVLCKYEECDPSPWERTRESMVVEWEVHNIFPLSDRTNDVDLNNEDEKKYDNILLRKLLKL